MQKNHLEQPANKAVSVTLYTVVALASLVVFGALIWQGVTASGNPDPTTPNISPFAVVLNTGLLVFREGLEAILVLAALTASFKGATQAYRRPVAAGAALALLASVATWFIAIALLDAVDAPALDIQAATGLLAIVVLLVIMNWFFHNVYWMGWISMHNKKRRDLMADTDRGRGRAMRGLVLLGFTAMYREGFEVVLFLQNLRLRAGSSVVLEGVTIGLIFTAVVGVLTFIVHKHLPYKKMLILTGLLLAGVLVVMVGESAQELQLAHWISTTPVRLPIPAWMGLWFAIFPTAESLIAQFVAGGLVIGSYFLAQYVKIWKPRRQAELASQSPSATSI